jgi:outer membrane protein OmpA-like peptidoglycan-associated protein
MSRENNLTKKQNEFSRHPRTDQPCNLTGNESRGKLYQLLLVLQQNKKLKINIQGHLCCVLSDKKDLSTQRAKAIYKFLEFNKIDKNRMSYQGFGSTIPLFSIPEKNESEREANRRVEIEIIEN